MSKTKVILRADDYKYPTLGERLEAHANYPTLTNFGFEKNNLIGAVLKGEISMQKAKKKGDLYYWDNCLLYKFGKLHTAYINLYTHYHRWVIGKKQETPQGNYINKHQFDFYTESFYYFLFSAREMILHILNVFFELQIDEGQVSIAKIKKKITDSFVGNMLAKLTTEFSAASKIRNSFTHRFPPNRKDFRMTHSVENNEEKLIASNGIDLPVVEIMGSIDQSLIFLSNWMDELRGYLNANQS